MLSLHGAVLYYDDDSTAEKWFQISNRTSDTIFDIFWSKRIVHVCAEEHHLTLSIDSLFSPQNPSFHILIVQ